MIELFPDILAHPDNDAPRLIYADRLEEQGDAENTAHANFIRAQCGAEAESDPFRAEDQRLYAEELLNRHGDAWVPEALREYVPEFRRGFVEKIRLSSEDFLNSALQKTIRAAAPLREIHIGGALPSDIPRIMASEHLKRYSALSFRVSRVGGGDYDTGIEALAASPGIAHLRALNLEFSGVSAHDAEALALSPHLTNLHTLNVKGNRIGDEGVSALAASPHLAGLHTLDLSCNDITVTGVRALVSEFSPLAHLHTLHLADHRHIGRSGMEALAASPHLKQLHVLNLRNNGTRLEGVTALAQSPHLTQLRTLNLGNDGLGSESARALAQSENFAHLHVLNLEDNCIGPEGAKAMAKSPYLKQLHTLKLENNLIGPEGAKAMAASPNFRHLRTLDLSVNFIGDEGMTALAESKQLTQLHTLDLTYNNIGRPGAEALAKSTNLKRLHVLHLNVNSISRKGAAALAAADFPELRVLNCDQALIDALRDRRNDLNAPVTWRKLETINDRPLSRYGIPTAEEALEARKKMPGSRVVPENLKGNGQEPGAENQL